jgi:hypothetical protein
MTVYNFTTLDWFSTGTVPAASTDASAINSGGAIVGTFQDNSETHGFVLAGIASGVISDPLAPNDTEVWGINDSSIVVGDYAGHGFLYNGPKGTYTTLSDPSGSTGTYVYGINNHDQFVGAY